MRFRRDVQPLTFLYLSLKEKLMGMLLFRHAEMLMSVFFMLLLEFLRLLVCRSRHGSIYVL